MFQYYLAATCSLPVCEQVMLEGKKKGLEIRTALLLQSAFVEDFIHLQSNLSTSTSFHFADYNFLKFFFFFF